MLLLYDSLGRLTKRKPVIRSLFLGYKPPDFVDLSSLFSHGEAIQKYTTCANSAVCRSEHSSLR